MPDALNLRLGKQPPRHDDRTLRLARYLDDSTLPTPPDTLDLTGGRGTWPMALNDRLGCCTCATASHMVEQWTAQAGSPTDVPDDAVLAAYEAVSGYNPQTGANDNGAVELDVLNFWRQTGVAGHQIGAFAAVNLTPDAVRRACWLFEGLYVGVQLPVTAQGQDVWDVVPNAGSAAYPGSWGGHAINISGYDNDGVTVITWGALKRATWTWLAAYLDEAYAIISADYLHAGQSPTGLDLEHLTADLAVVTA